MVEQLPIPASVKLLLPAASSPNGNVTTLADQQQVPVSNDDLMAKIRAIKTDASMAILSAEMDQVQVDGKLMANLW